jgi:imidazolonepropionase
MSKTKSKSKQNADLLLVNAEELLTLSNESSKPRIGKQMAELGIIHDGAVAIRDGKIVGVGKTHEITKAFKAASFISAQGKVILPGFVDPHTHLVFAGSREEEFQTRIQGASYLEILNSGGGILKTVKETRRASVEKLTRLGLERLDNMIAHGTTTLESKSGYGLSLEDELKILEVIKRLNQLHSSNIVSTFMGAQAIPIEYRGNNEDYVKFVIKEMIPAVSKRGLAEFCDVFCERGAFSLEQAKRILVNGKTLGLKPKIHADEMSLLGGAEIAADVGAISAEHLIYSSSNGVRAMAEKGVIAVLLPAAAFSLMTGKYANARLMIDSGVPIALGTDFNASCWVENQQLVIAMACHFMHLTQAEAITAATINAAYAIDRASEVGSLEVGKRADAIILNIPNHRFLGYRFGVNLVDKVIKNGRVVVDREKQDEPVFLNKNE